MSVGDQPHAVFVSGRYAYVANRNDDSVSIVDITNPVAPFVVTTKSVGVDPVHVFVSGRYAYVANNAGASISIFDVSGIETNGLIAANASLGTLSVLGNSSFADQLSVNGALTVGRGGIFTDGSLAVNSTNTISTFNGTVSTSQLYVAGELVCLASGTNCPASSGGSNWIYEVGDDFLRPGTSTSDVVIGGTSTTVDFMNSLFALNGGSLFVANNIGSASSIYTNGAFVAGDGVTFEDYLGNTIGTGPTYYQNGLILQRAGTLYVRALHDEPNAVGGNINIAGGNGLPTLASGGYVELVGGQAAFGGNGGPIFIAGGISATTSASTGGLVQIIGGSGDLDGTGGGVTLAGGDSLFGVAGNIRLNGGVSAVDNLSGSIYLKPGYTATSLDTGASSTFVLIESDVSQTGAPRRCASRKRVRLEQTMSDSELQRALN